MPMQLYKHEAMLLELLRASLNGKKADPALFQHITDKEWRACYKLAGSQGVTALTWDGVTTLPNELFPPIGIKLSWGITASNQEKYYQYYCHTVIELSELYARHGIKSLVMKGVGLSTIYPNPKHREGGDIDIYTYAADRTAMTDEEANQLADKLMEDQGINVDRDFYKDSAFFYRKIFVENHKHFLAVLDFKFAAEVEKILLSNVYPQEVELVPGKRKILVPSDAFNTLFLAFHAVQHYSRGLCLHHLADWACLMNRNGLEIPKELTNPHYIDILHTLTAFTNTYLGTHVNTEYNEEKLNDLFIEVMRTPYEEHYPTSNRLAIFFYRIKRLVCYRRVLKRVVGEPILSGCWSVFRRRIKKPSTMFRKGE